MIQKVLAIARTEYLQAVCSKAFLIGILVMPILMGGGIAFQVLMRDRVDLDDRHCAIFDPSGEFWPILEAAVERRNNETIWSTEEEGEPQQTRPKFILERVDEDSVERLDLALSDRVRDGELIGFALLDPSLLEAEQVERPFAYHTDEPTFTELPRWIEKTVNEELRNRRFATAGLDRGLVEQLNRHISLSTWGLVKERDDGTVDEAEADNKIRTFLVPVAGIALLFMLVMTTAPQLMNQVLEEKMQKISEILVSAVSPFELMLGKLLGSVAVSLTLALLYLGGVFWLTHHYEVSHFIPFSVYVWFLVLMVFALLMYGSLFSALGSACSELRDAQNLMMPAMVILMVPMFALGAIVESPNGSLAAGLTYFPTATPMILVFRVLALPGPTTLELIGGMLMCIGTTVALLWASAKIFRIGILSQGETPTFRQLIGWVFSK